MATHDSMFIQPDPIEYGDDWPCVTCKCPLGIHLPSKKPSADGGLIEVLECRDCLCTDPEPDEDFDPSEPDPDEAYDRAGEDW